MAAPGRGQRPLMIIRGFLVFLVFVYVLVSVFFQKLKACFSGSYL